jgi:hypothetical protein
LGKVLAVPRLCELYPDICLTTEEKVRRNLSQGQNPEDGTNSGRNKLVRTLECIMLVNYVLYTCYILTVFVDIIQKIRTSKRRLCLTKHLSCKNLQTEHNLHFQCRDIVQNNNEHGDRVLLYFNGKLYVAGRRSVLQMAAAVDGNHSNRCG